MKKYIKKFFLLSGICSLMAIAYLIGKDSGYDEGYAKAKKRFDEEYIFLKKTEE